MQSGLQTLPGFQLGHPQEHFKKMLTFKIFVFFPLNFFYYINPLKSVLTWLNLLALHVMSNPLCLS